MMLRVIGSEGGGGENIGARDPAGGVYTVVCIRKTIVLWGSVMWSDGPKCCGALTEREQQAQIIFRNPSCWYDIMHSRDFHKHHPQRQQKRSPPPPSKPPPTKASASPRPRKTRQKVLP